MDWVTSFVAFVCQPQPSSSSSYNSSAYASQGRPTTGTCQSNAMNSRGDSVVADDQAGLQRRLLQILGLKSVSCMMTLLVITMITFAILGVSAAIFFGGSKKRKEGSVGTAIGDVSDENLDKGEVTADEIDQDEVGEEIACEDEVDQDDVDKFEVVGKDEVDKDVVDGADKASESSASIVEPVASKEEEEE